MLREFVAAERRLFSVHGQGVCVAVCCSVLQCVCRCAAEHRATRYAADCSSLRFMCLNVLQCDAVF